MAHEQSPASGEVVLQVKDSLATIFLGASDENLVLLDEKRILSLTNILNSIVSDKSIKGLVVIGPGPEMFCAGADISLISQVEDSAKGEQLARIGQEAFSKLASLKIPKVAAISGPCIGGGCELVLACDYRIITDLSQSKIGLPETKLGILPGFGGTQRLPRLIGLPAALDIMLTGKVLSPEKAYLLGLVDKVLSDSGAKGNPYSSLKQYASEVALGQRTIDRPSMTLLNKLLTFTPVGRHLVAYKARKKLLEKTAGKYPAPLKVLETSLAGLSKGIRAGLPLEAKAIGALIVSPEGKSLVHVYTASSAASRIGKSQKVQVAQSKVAVVGAGVMGAGIAASALQAGSMVVLYDPFEEARKRATEHVHRSMSRQRSVDPRKYESRFIVTDKLVDISSAELVIEAVPENLDLKKNVLSEIEGQVSKETIIATNTSSIPIAELSSALSQLERFIGIHFFNPVEGMKLVEVVRGSMTGERAIATSAAFSSFLGKYPVIVEDVPGFLVNRILTPYLVESFHLLREGFHPLDIELAARDFGMPMGPLRLFDEVGFDIAKAVAEELERSYGTRMSGPDFLGPLISKGMLGKKSGQGFYRYNDGGEEFNESLIQLLGLTNNKRFDKSKIGFLANRLILPLVNEAIRCFDEGVAGHPGKEAASQIDLATVMGIGFAPFRGGVMHYAASLGVEALVDSLDKLDGERFEVAEGLRLRLEKGKGLLEAVW